MVSDATPKIEAGDFSMPVVERIAPLEFLFLTCNNSDSYLRESREPLPAIYPLICQVGNHDHDQDHHYDIQQKQQLCKREQRTPIILSSARWETMELQVSSLGTISIQRTKGRPPIQPG